jgi:hypothetical protein
MRVDVRLIKKKGEIPSLVLVGQPGPERITAGSPIAAPEEPETLTGLEKYLDILRRRLKQELRYKGAILEDAAGVFEINITKGVVFFAESGNPDIFYYAPGILTYRVKNDIMMKKEGIQWLRSAKNAV